MAQPQLLWEWRNLAEKLEAESTKLRAALEQIADDHHIRDLRGHARRVLEDLKD